MQHHRRAPVIASIAAMADDSDGNLAHNDEAQLQRLLDSMGQESAAAPRPTKKKSSKGSAEERPQKKKSNKGAVSKFRSEQKQKRRGTKTGRRPMHEGEIHHDLRHWHGGPESRACRRRCEPEDVASRFDLC